MDETHLVIPTEYAPFLEDLKERIRTAQVRAAVSLNQELVMLYWNIGRRIAAAQETEGYGTKIIPRLSADLTRAFPEMKGFSSRNLDYMLAFARAWRGEEVSQAALAKLTWYHNITLLEKLESRDLRLWYASQAVEYGWSRNVLVHQIESKLYERQGKALTNFPRALPSPQSDLASQLLKDPTTSSSLLSNMMPKNASLKRDSSRIFASFSWSSARASPLWATNTTLEVGGQDFYIDLLFYHLKLRCFVVIELKTGKFLPEYAGKLNYYLAVVDDLLRHESDAPTIGLILCKDKNQIVAEYSLKGMIQPMGVSEYQITAALPETLQGSLPTIEQIENELSGASDEE